MKFSKFVCLTSVFLCINFNENSKIKCDKIIVIPEDYLLNNAEVHRITRTTFARNKECQSQSIRNCSKDSHKTIVLEGNIGSGKTTILNYVKNLTDIELSQNRSTNGQMVLYENGYISESELKELKTKFENLVKSGNLGDEIVLYIKTTPEVAFNRIKNRGRYEELTVDFDYIKKIYFYTLRVVLTLNLLDFYENIVGLVRDDKESLRVGWVSYDKESLRTTLKCIVR
uniref:Deoxynucleoside kinase domain-containing protein n=1 Tax=Megaselia scalaris TaxID=36166 RepID=T1GLR7_MEGSC